MKANGVVLSIHGEIHELTNTTYKDEIRFSKKEIEVFEKNNFESVGPKLVIANDFLQIR